MVFSTTKLIFCHVLHCILGKWWISIEPRKQPFYFPLFWLVNGDPYIGLWNNPYITGEFVIPDIRETTRGPFFIAQLIHRFSRILFCKTPHLWIHWGLVCCGDCRSSVTWRWQRCWKVCSCLRPYGQLIAGDVLHHSQTIYIYIYMISKYIYICIYLFRSSKLAKTWWCSYWNSYSSDVLSKLAIEFWFKFGKVPDICLKISFHKDSWFQTFESPMLHGFLQ